MDCISVGSSHRNYEDLFFFVNPPPRWSFPRRGAGGGGGGVGILYSWDLDLDLSSPKGGGQCTVQEELREKGYATKVKSKKEKKNQLHFPSLHLLLLSS